jgi:hypothetical protein
LHPQNKKDIRITTRLYNIIRNLPTSALLPGLLEYVSYIADKGLARIWKGKLNDTNVTIVAFNTWSMDNLEIPMQVSKRPAYGVYS